MRFRMVQALALVTLLHVVSPLVEPPQIQPGQLEEHYGETIRIRGHVTAVSPAGEVNRIELASPTGAATVLTRARPPPLGASVVVRGQAAPGQAGPVVWAEGRIEPTSTGPDGPLAVDQALVDAPRLSGSPLAVAGTWPADGDGLVGSEGRLAVETLGIAPQPGRAVLWGQLVYEPETARYELEATGWRRWTPPSG